MTASEAHPATAPAIAWTTDESDMTSLESWLVDQIKYREEETEMCVYICVCVSVECRSMELIM